jgi:hypothetical protein
MTAPVGSVTVPESVAVDCAHELLKQNARKMARTSERSFIQPPEGTAVEATLTRYNETAETNQCLVTVE